MAMTNPTERDRERALVYTDQPALVAVVAQVIADERARLQGDSERLRKALREIWFAPVSDDTAMMRMTAKRALLGPSEDKTDGE